jgi:hypothetical protein
MATIPKAELPDGRRHSQFFANLNGREYGRQWSFKKQKGSNGAVLISV